MLNLASASQFSAGVPSSRLSATLEVPGRRSGRPERPAALPGLVDGLTERELDVLRLLSTGSSNQAIAAELVVALDTVKKHVSHVLSKLGATNRTEAVARGRQLGLLPRCDEEPSSNVVGG
jgi:LuxR family maltose regulon positive regulatory protein